MARERWGVEGRSRARGYQDRNFRFGSGHVLKAANAVTDVAEFEAQNASTDVPAEAGLRAPWSVESIGCRTIGPSRSVVSRWTRGC